MPLTVGGGVRTVEDVRALLLAGADKVAHQHRGGRRPGAGARAPPTRFGSQAIVVAIDARRDRAPAASRWEVFTHGGRTPTGLDAVEWCERVAARSAPARSCSPAWTATARATATTSS